MVSLWEKFEVTIVFGHYFNLGDCRHNEVDNEVEGSSESIKNKT